MTTQATHTPGPWEISKNEAGELDICEAGAGNMLADLAKCKNAEANARLIAAAPDLLEALRGLIDQLEAAGIHIPGEDSGQWHGAEGISFSRAIEAIAKAEGRAE
jgi:hypothetical protein